MEILGYIAVFFVGLMLAIIGGGGSILMVPILFYLFELPADISTSYSLFLVGFCAALGAFQYYRQDQIFFRIGIIFAVPAFIGVFIVRKFLMPIIPHSFEILDYLVTKDKLILIVFAILMLLSSVSMILNRNNKSQKLKISQKNNIFLIAIEGLTVGGITGFVGAGGGFLIIPALVLLADLPIKKAVGTSLMIIAAKSLIGFIGDIGAFKIDWIFLMILSIISALGIVSGSFISKFVKAETLKPLFGYFTLLMGSLIIAQQLLN